MPRKETPLDAKRYLFSFEKAPMGIVWHDADGKIIHVNPYAARKLEYTPDELAGNYLYKFVVLDTRRETESYYSQEPSEKSTHNLFTRSGNVIPVQVLVYGAGPQEGDFGCAFFTDITENVRLKELLGAVKRETGYQFTNFSQRNTKHIPREMFRDFIGESRPIKEVFKLICRVAPTPTTVMVMGETGTGKELVARKIHELSGRKKSRLVKVNCATLPAHLIEGELFGHEKGAFTGAHTRKPGRFELADGGTIFLDEIGEMPMELQAKLLRVLQEGEFERLGGTTTLKVDVRVVAATNRNLEKLVKKGKFRSDLYFRISIFPIKLPSLRERKEDILLLSHFFTHNFCKTLNRKPKTVPPEFSEKLQEHSWPGNVRELQNVVERACILSTDDSLSPSCITFSSMSAENNEPKEMPSFEENERRYIEMVLQKTGGKIFGPDGAAAIMKINPRTLTSKINKLNIDKALSHR